MPKSKKYILEFERVEAEEQASGMLSCKGCYFSSGAIDMGCLLDGEEDNFGCVIDGINYIFKRIGDRVQNA